MPIQVFAGDVISVELVESIVKGAKVWRAYLEAGGHVRLPYGHEVSYMHHIYPGIKDDIEVRYDLGYDAVEKINELISHYVKKSSIV